MQQTVRHQNNNTHEQYISTEFMSIFFNDNNFWDSFLPLKKRKPDF